MTVFEKVKQMSVEDMALMLMCPAEYDTNFNKKSKCTARSQTVIIALYTGLKARWKNDTK